MRETFLMMRNRKQALPLTDRTLELIAGRFRALGEPLRLRILQVLEAGEAPVGEIVSRLDATQSNVSRHLQNLYDAGLVGRRRQGSSKFYSIADPMVSKICRLVCEHAQESARTHLAELTSTASRHV